MLSHPRPSILELVDKCGNCSRSDPAKRDRLHCYVLKQIEGDSPLNSLYQEGDRLYGAQLTKDLAKVILDQLANTGPVVAPEWIVRGKRSVREAIEHRHE